MSVFTVHEPPPRGAASASDPERIVFVRDGFYFWAFLFTALWMVRYRMWLVLAIYLVMAIGIESALRYAGLGAGGIALVGLAIKLLVGLEAGTLRRFALARRGFRNIGVVSGEDLEDAERRFFDAWTRGGAGKATAPPAPAPAFAPAPTRHTTGIVGLFPDPGASQ